jgi:hypothetical protein
MEYGFANINMEDYTNKEEVMRMRGSSFREKAARLSTLL